MKKTMQLNDAQVREVAASDVVSSASPVGARAMAQRRACLLGLAPLLVVVLCGAVPPEKGLTYSGSLGYNDQDISTGCSSVRMISMPVHASMRQLYNNGVSVSADATLTPLQREDQRELLVEGSVAARLGYHGQYAGIELGPSFSINPTLTDAFPLLASYELWAGKPELAYAYLRGMTGSISPNLWNEIGAVGIGTVQPNFKGSVELPVMAFDGFPNHLLSSFSPELHGSVKVSPEAWLDFEVGLGAMTATQPLSDRRFLLGFTYQPKGKF
ncbi:MAG: hypothetical protein ACKO6N_09420 [Myxococcota bacterium]